MNVNILLLTICIAASLSCGEEKVRTYQVAGEEKETTLTTPATPPSPSPELIGKLRWKAPDNWEKQTPGQFQLELYKINAGASLAISSLPGDAGGIPANVNRWRGQIGLPSTEDVGGDVIEVESEGVSARWFELKGAEQSILAAIITLPKETWFFKLTCSTSELEGMREQFQNFLATVDMETIANSQETPPQPEPQPEASTVKKSGIGLNIPEGWVKSEGTSMRVASFSIPGNGVPDGDVSVVPLMGESGSILENVNRWRGQVKLPALASEKDPAIGTEKQGTAGTFLITHMVSTESLFEGERKGGISTAILKRGDTTWFFKLAAEAELLEKNRDAFEKFVLTAEIP
jgi:hypothetical protein